MMDERARKAAEPEAGAREIADNLLMNGCCGELADAVIQKLQVIVAHTSNEKAVKAVDAINGLVRDHWREHREREERLRPKLMALADLLKEVRPAVFGFHAMADMDSAIDLVAAIRKEVEG